MLSPLFGNENSERVLLFILKRDGGYAREMSRFFDVALYAIQRQLEKLEKGSVLVSKKVGQTRVYQFNPRYPFLKELTALLEKAYTFYPEETREKMELNRRRPRRKGKPL